MKYKYVEEKTNCCNQVKVLQEFENGTQVAVGTVSNIGHEYQNSPKCEIVSISEWWGIATMDWHEGHVKKYGSYFIIDNRLFASKRLALKFAKEYNGTHIYKLSNPTKLYKINND